MKWKPSQNASENARALLPKVVEKYFKAGREAAHRKLAPHELHRFRLATKRLRYTLELFRPVYGPRLDARIRLLRELQSTLGKLSDYHSIQTILEGDKAVEAKLQRAAKKTLKEFQQQWKAFDSDGQLKRWKAYFTRGTTRRAR